MSDTPRTDSAFDHYFNNDGGSVLTIVELSRQLERELAAATARERVLREALGTAINALDSLGYDVLKVKKQEIANQAHKYAQDARAALKVTP